jgi:hypothetical protein
LDADGGFQRQQAIPIGGTPSSEPVKLAIGQKTSLDLAGFGSGSRDPWCRDRSLPGSSLPKQWLYFKRKPGVKKPFIENQRIHK